MAKAKLAYFRPQDDDVFEYIEGLPNFSEWVRDRARREMQGDGSMAAMIERILEIKLAGRLVMATDQSIQKGENVVSLDQFF